MVQCCWRIITCNEKDFYLRGYLDIVQLPKNSASYCFESLLVTVRKTIF